MSRKASTTPPAGEQFDEPVAMLMGRKTYEGLTAYWAPLAGEWADKINLLPKYGDLAWWAAASLPVTCSRTGSSTSSGSGSIPRSAGKGTGLRGWRAAAIAARRARAFDSGVSLLRYELVL
jgi:hypothetical protein